MKGILVIIDGMGDLPHKALNNMTPLEAAEKPNLDNMASHGKIGYLYSIKENVAPESDAAIVSLFGNNPFMSTRGQLEALGAGLELKRGDLALRTNFATITSIRNGKVIDRRAGRTLTTKEAKLLAESINQQVKLPCKFIFKPTIQHRGVLVLNGGFSDNITNTDPAYPKKGVFELKEDLKFSQPLDEEDNSKYTSNIINEFIEESFKILNLHQVNQERVKKGLMPANIILTRDAGIELPKLNKLKKWLAIVYMPLEIGIAKSSNMQIFSFPYPEMRDYDVYANLHEALKKAIDFSIATLKKQEKNFNYAYIHFKETDVPGHDNKPHEKKAMLELLDKEFFSFLREFAEKKKIKIAITADHSTPCKLKSHSADPVPLLVFNPHEQEKKHQTFCEKEAIKGELGKIYGSELLKKIGFS